jgi:hypothetical protein
VLPFCTTCIRVMERTGLFVSMSGHTIRSTQRARFAPLRCNKVL